MYRFSYVSVILSLFILLSFLTGCSGAKDTGPNFRKDVKNVIVIAVDTLAARNLHFMGYNRDTSPFLDELAAKSVVFENCYTPKALTLPSFTSILSGQHPVTHNVQSNGEKIPDDIHRLTENFQESGFFTFGVAAAKVISNKFGMDKGFDIYLGGKEYEIPAAKVMEHVQNFLGDKLDENFPKWDKKQPLFMFVHFFDTHTDYKPYQKYLDQWADKNYPGPVTGKIRVFEDYNAKKIELNDADLEHTRDLYDAEIRTFDDSLRAFFNILSEHGFLKNSVIVVTADHGENLGEHQYITHGHPYEAALHVPLLIHFPNDLGAGTRLSGIVQTIDIIPTAMDVVKIEYPENLDGRSLMPAIHEPHLMDNIKLPFVLSCGGTNAENKRTYAVFDGRYRLIKDIRWSKEPLLYDILNDPDETTDIAMQNPDLVNALLEILEKLSAGEKAWEPIEYDPETEEMLRSLGYLGS